MRKLLSVLSSTLQGGVRRGLLFFALLATTTLWAHDFKVNGIYYNYLDGNNVEVTYKGSSYTSYYDEYSGEVTIPKTVTYNGTTYSVTSIGSDAFQCSYSLTSITILNSVTSIGDRAFSYCKSLTSVTIPNSVTSIGDYAFFSCIFAKENFVNNSVLDAEENNYWGASIGDTEIDGLLIRNDTVIDCRPNVTSVIIPEGVTSIGNHAFEWCSLTSITIPESVTSIGTNAFYECSSLTSITIPNSVTSIGDYAFSYCSSLTSVTIGESVTSIGDYAFSGCFSLTSITIPNSVTSIGDAAFSACSSLTSVTIPNNVTSIADYTFYGCSSLTSITIGNSVTSIGEEAFNGTAIYKNKSNWKNDVLYIDNCLIVAKTSISGAYAIKENTRLIADDAFYGCSSLTSVTIPNSVTSIGYSAFYDCSSLTSFTIGNGVTSIGANAFYGCSSLTSITIPNSVTSIGKGAFSNCSSLTSITIPNSVTSIGEYAFRGTGIYNNESNWENDVLYIDNCLIVAKTSIADAYAIKENTRLIGNHAFYGCSSLTSITIPNSVTSIGNWAFIGCIFAKENFVNHSVLDAEENDYWGATIGDTEIDGLLIRNDTVIDCRPNVTSVIIPNSVMSIGSSAFSSCSKLTSVTIPNSVTSIGYMAFAYCSSLTSITIPNSVTSIGYRAFEDCFSLTSITIPNSVTSIGGQTFWGCRSLTSVTIPNSVTSIGYRAFEDCSSLTSITIPNSVTSIGNHAFYYCIFVKENFINNSVLNAEEHNYWGARIVDTEIDGLLIRNDTVIDCRPNVTSAIIPNSVTSIGDEAFSDCSSLTHITLGNSITSINSDAFKGCSSLTSIVWNVKQWTNPNNYSPFSDIKTNITSFTFGNDVEQIPAYICFGMEKLNAVNIPNATTSIGENAFAGCTKLYDIYCYAMEPPTAYESSFANYNAFLHVPCDNQRVYLLDVIFGNFKYIECIEAEITPTDTVVVTPSFNDAEFIWPSNSSADSYTLAISKDGEVFCTLTFNANGQLTGIAFAPSRNGQHNAPAAAQTANGFAFTVTGLDEGANYTYELLIQDRSGNTLQSYSGEFRTQSTNDRTVTVEYDAAQGQVTGAGTYLVGDTVTLTATPNDGYRFVRWSNEVEDNPYTFVISDNVTLSAEFEAVIHSDVENATPSQQSDTHKLLRDGQLLIIRDGKTYNAMGQEL